MTLNSKGRKRLFVLAASALLAPIYAILTLSFSPDPEFSLFSPELTIFLVLVPGIYYTYLSKKMRVTLEKQSLESIGFTHYLKSDDFEIGDMGYEKRSLKIEQVFIGEWNRHSLSFISFTITVGSGKNKKVYSYWGALYRTERASMPIQVYDVKSAYGPSYFKSSVKLESNDFNERFKVYSPDPKFAFHELDPDTMHDMMNFKRDLGLKVNLEMKDHRVLIYFNRESFDRLLKARPQFVDTLNGATRPEVLASKSEVIRKFLDNSLKLYIALNKKISQRY